jgi:hypothetical protein
VCLGLGLTGICAVVAGTQDPGTIKVGMDYSGYLVCGNHDSGDTGVSDKVSQIKNI